MMLRVACGLALGTAVLTVVNARSARACSLPPPVSSSTLLTPATSLPLNGRVRVSLPGSSDGSGPGSDPRLDVSIRPVQGEPVPAKVELVPGGVLDWSAIAVLTPDAPLAPSTTYEVLTRFPTDGCGGPCPTAEPVVIGTVTTGTTTDDTPPSFAGLATVTEGTYETCDSSACCGPYGIRRFGLTWGEATDAVGVAAYRVYRLDDKGQRQLALETAGKTASGFSLCDGLPSGGGPGFVQLYGAGTFAVTAVDLAGNEDGNTITMTLEPSCTPDPIDAGPDSTADGGGHPADGGGHPAEPDDDGDCGCRVGGRARGAMPAGGWLAMLVVLAARRRRR
jgi:hypothetical protein